jgi:hypothetical protein
MIADTITDICLIALFVLSLIGLGIGAVEAWKDKE